MHLRERVSVGLAVFVERLELVAVATAVLKVRRDALRGLVLQLVLVTDEVRRRGPAGHRCRRRHVGSA